MKQIYGAAFVPHRLMARQFKGYDIWLKAIGIIHAAGR
jgi:hypothetical protein